MPRRRSAGEEGQLAFAGSPHIQQRPEETIRIAKYSDKLTGARGRNGSSMQAKTICTEIWKQAGVIN